MNRLNITSGTGGACRKWKEEGITTVMGMHSREADVFLAPWFPHYKAFSSTALTIHSFFHLLNNNVLSSSMCQSFCRDKRIELRTKLRWDRKERGGREDGRKEGRKERWMDMITARWVGVLTFPALPLIPSTQTPMAYPKQRPSYRGGGQARRRKRAPKIRKDEKKGEMAANLDLLDCLFSGA